MQGPRQRRICARIAAVATCGNLALGTLSAAAHPAGEVAAQQSTIGSGSYAASATISGSADLNFDPTSSGSYVYDYVGASAALSVNHSQPILASIAISPTAAANSSAGSPILWDDVTAWDSGWGTGDIGLSLVNAAQVTAAINNIVQSPLDFQNYTTVSNIFGSAGPTEKSATFSATITTSDIADAIGVPASEIEGLPSAGVSFNFTPVFDFNVTIPSPAVVVMDQQNVTLEGLTVDSGATLGGNNTMTLKSGLLNQGTFYSAGGTIGGTINNSGLITAGTLNSQAGVINSGTVDVGLNSSLVVSGPSGNMSSGIINASGGSVNFTSGTVATNQGLIEATAGGVLNISGTISQGSTGVIAASGTSAGGSGSAINLSGGTIFGGTLNFDPGSVMNVSGSSTLANVTSNATIQQFSGGSSFTSALNITGFLTDNGLVVVNSTGDTHGQYWGGAGIDFHGGVLSGSGTVQLNPAPNAISGGDDVRGAELFGDITQAAAHSITGYGQVTATLTNDGTVNANYAGQMIEVLPPGATELGGAATLEVTNNGLMEATGGGTLQIDSGVTMANNGAVVATSGSTVNVAGTINQSGSGTLTILSGGTANILATGLLEGTGSTTGNLSNSGTLEPGDASGILAISGDLIDKSTAGLFIQIAGTQPGTQYSVLAINGSISLAGTLTLNFRSGFAPQAGDKFDFLQLSPSSRLSGNFDQITLNGLLPGFQYALGPDPAGGLEFTALNNGVPTPEPRALALLAIGVGTMPLARRCRRRPAARSRNGTSYDSFFA